MVTTLFFMWGFLTCLNDILIPHLKSIFDLNYAEVMLVQFAFFSCLFACSPFPPGRVIERVGYHMCHGCRPVHHGLGRALVYSGGKCALYPLYF